MKRFCAQFIFCSPEKILRQSVIEQNESGLITQIFSLHKSQSESAHTLFVDGIISRNVLSLKERLTPIELNEIKERYTYIDLSDGLPFGITDKKNSPLLIDFGTSNPTEINQLLKNNVSYFYRIPLFEFISACTYYPHEAIKSEPELGEQLETNLILWKGNDLINRNITEKTSITLLA